MVLLWNQETGDLGRCRRPETVCNFLDCFDCCTVLGEFRPSLPSNIALRRRLRVAVLNAGQERFQQDSGEEDCLECVLEPLLLNVGSLNIATQK